MVYGLINLVQWPFDLQKMTVNYNATAFEVARCALAHYPVDHPQDVLDLAELLVVTLHLADEKTVRSFRSSSSSQELPTDSNAVHPRASKVNIYSEQNESYHTYPCNHQVSVPRVGLSLFDSRTTPSSASTDPCVVFVHLTKYILKYGLAT